MMPNKSIGSQGKIALPLILLAALCFRDQLVNAVDVVRPSWIVCKALSFPVGWIAKSFAELLAQTIVTRHETAASFLVFTAACAGSVLNIYLLAFGITSVCRKFRKNDHV